ncbi:MAG: hypothetical protein ACI8X5_003537 [Planctomycetota bacterium]|jgi:hypothetical protein
MNSLTLKFAILALASSNVALANDLAIDVTGTVISTNGSVLFPFGQATVGDSVWFHCSLPYQADLSVPNTSTYQLYVPSSHIRIGDVTWPISNVPLMTGVAPVKLVDDTVDTLEINVLMPGNEEWISTTIMDPSGSMIANRDIAFMQGHSAGPFTAAEGGTLFLSAAGTELAIQIDQLSFGPQGDPFNGPYCFGDGPCPCGNSSTKWHGEACTNSTGVGARMSVFGSSSATSDSISLVAIQTPPSTYGLLFAGTATANGFTGAPVGDGLLCVSGTTQRLHIQLSSAQGVMVWGPGILADVGALGGQTRYFQSWFRDSNGGPCGGNFNFSNGVLVHVLP